MTNGGAGTVGEALEAGVPMVVLPLHSDQPENAWRVQRAGLGLRLAADSSPAAIRAAVGRVLRDRRFADRSREVRDTVRATGARYAATQIDALL